MKVWDQKIIKINFLRSIINNYNNDSSDQEIIQIQFLRSNIK